MEVAQDDYDSPWKEALETFLPDCLALFLPEAHEAIDWSKESTFLDQELRQIQRDAELGRQVVDKLVQVYLRDGSDAWVLIHLEVQSQPEADFAKRMFTYYYRLLDHYDHPVASLAILADERSTWRPHNYETDLWGSGIRFTFRTVKLLDLRARLSELEASRNPFAIIVAAHLRAQETRRNPTARLMAKLTILRQLYDVGYNRGQILGLFRFIDWVMALPSNLERRFRDEVDLIEEDKRVRYVTSVERIGREEGLQQGRQEGRQEGVREGLIEAIEVALKVKFGDQSLSLITDLQRITDVPTIRALYAQVIAAATIEEVRLLLR